MVDVRPLTPEDAPAVYDVQAAAFADLAERHGAPSYGPPADPEPGRRRIRHLATTDPGGAWVATDGGEVVGASLGLVREGLWGLSLLVVRPGRQSGGVGSELLRRALAHGDGTRGGIILSSEDPRALRVYARAGFDLRPSVDASGRVTRQLDEAPGVRLGRWPEDRPIVDAAGHAVRGASHATDLPNWIAAGAEFLVHDGGGFAFHGDGTVRVLAATSDEIAAALLRTVLARTPLGDELDVMFIDAGQPWAIPPVLDAGLSLRPAGATFVRGDVGPLRPFLPSGSYL
jgi:GNAT superfamily N-acetyltransferase